MTFLVTPIIIYKNGEKIMAKKIIKDDYILVFDNVSKEGFAAIETTSLDMVLSLYLADNSEHPQNSLLYR